jgi:stage III sporulation protein AD
MQLVSLVGIALIGAVICLILKQFRPEYAVAAALAVGAVILLAVCSAVTPILQAVESFSQLAQLQQEDLAALFKMVGLCWLTALGADVCRDAGQTALAGKVELAGRIAILLVVLPLFTELMQLAIDLIGNTE